MKSDEIKDPTRVNGLVERCVWINAWLVSWLEACDILWRAESLTEDSESLMDSVVLIDSKIEKDSEVLSEASPGVVAEVLSAMLSLPEINSGIDCEVESEALLL